MKQLEDYVSVKNALTSQTVATTGTATGTILDSEREDGTFFDTALFIANVGTVASGGTYNIKVEESNDGSSFTSSSICDGGALTDVSGGGVFTFQVIRSKRYLRVSLVVGGTLPSIPVSVDAILCNWQFPDDVHFI